MHTNTTYEQQNGNSLYLEPSSSNLVNATYALKNLKDASFVMYI